MVNNLKDYLLEDEFTSAMHEELMSGETEEMRIRHKVGCVVDLTGKSLSKLDYWLDVYGVTREQYETYKLYWMDLGKKDLD